MSNEFQRRWRAAQSQHNAAKRRGRYKKKGPWDKQYLGMIKHPKGEPDEPGDHSVHPPPGEQD